MIERIDVALASSEKEALFAVLWAMARADGHIDQPEAGVLEAIHQELFAAPLTVWVQPLRFHTATAAAALRTPAARRLLLQLLYEVMESDGLELGDELSLFAQAAGAIGLEDPEVRGAWEGAARDIHARATRDLAQRRFAALGRELSRLRRTLYLDAAADQAAEAIVHEELERFEVP